MADFISPEKRSKLMSRIKSKNTRPEIIVRKLVYSMGYRYRLHANDLPGKPDMVFRSRRKVIFVHGCFWHQHQGCKHNHIPKSNLGYWVPKLSKTVKRDKENIKKLELMGWSALVIWECHIAHADKLKSLIINFLAD